MFNVGFDLSVLFLVSFLAATIFPAQSEIVLGGLYLTGKINALLLLLVATVGNVLGSCVNWVLGRFIRRFQGRKWFPVGEKTLNRATKIYQKYGIWSLLFAWVPFIGDPLTIVAGMLRVNIYVFFTLVAIGKCARYGVVLYALGYRF